MAQLTVKLRHMSDSASVSDLVKVIFSQLAPTAAEVKTL